MGPSFHLRTPPAWFFKFPPDAEPLALPPPTDARTFASPFAIDAKLYNDALDWKVPVTIGALYASTAIIMNKINRDRGNKAWPISKTRPFKAFVILHNIFLAVFSALTFVGMIRALAHTWPGHRERVAFGKYWPGLRTENGLAGAADALCKMHGPRGFGDASYYLPFEDVWTNKNKLIHLTGSGVPDSTDVGRLWNEGLAFWGWWFYLSKFYEVFDTAIILAKGKRSSTLQTYHHAGAMMCMWAGIRFMSPPIWMFAFLNSGIHTMMYIYYTLSALGVKVPQRVKRTLTTLQISQFIIGITFAGLHLFVAYSVPVQRPYTVMQSVSSVASAASSAVSSAGSAVATAGVVSWLKKAAFRAAGEEGLAEKVHNEKGELFGPEVRAPALNRGETLFRTQYETIPCIDTNGQAFAIWLNLAYLAPLTGLFVRFFIRSYSRRGGNSTKHQTHRRKASQALQDAAHEVDQELDSLGKSAENGFGGVANNIKRVVNNNTPKSVDKRRVSATIEQQWERFEKGAEETFVDLKDTVKRNSPMKPGQSLKKKRSEANDKIRRMFEDGEGNGNRSDSIAQDGVEKAKQTAEAAKENSKPYTTDAMERLEESAEASVRKTKEAVGMAQEWISDAAGAGEGESKSIAEDVREKAASLKDGVESTDGKEQHDERSQRSDSNASEPPKSPAVSHPDSQQRNRNRSPQKSKIPQSTTKRNGSPTKKAAAATTPTSRPHSQGPTNTNGTKQQNPTSSPKQPAGRSDSVDDDGAKATPSSSSSLKRTSSNEEETNSGKQAPPSGTVDSKAHAAEHLNGESGDGPKRSASKSADGPGKGLSTADRSEGITFADESIKGGGAGEEG